MHSPVAFPLCLADGLAFIDRDWVELNANRFMLGGLGVLALGYLWLLYRGFKQNFGWGLIALLTPVPFVAGFGLYIFTRQVHWWWIALACPLLLFLILARLAGKVVVPSLLLLIGVVAASFPPLFLRFVPLDLGPRDRLVNDEHHLTLTGWDRNSYSFLEGRPEVVVLQMANEDVTDETLQYLKGMTRLRTLDLSNSRVTDRGLKALSDLPALKILLLRKTKVTDEGVRDSLRPMDSLLELDVSGTKVSKEARKDWERAKKKRAITPAPWE
jgi:hypothetical protein